MKMYLIREDLWRYVNNEISPTNLQSSSWLRGDEKALATIALGCDKSQFALFRSCTHAREAWFAISNYYVQKTTLSKVSLLKKMFNKKLSLGGDMQQHLLEFEALFEQLTSQNVELDELFRAVILLFGYCWS